MALLLSAMDKQLELAVAQVIGLAEQLVTLSSAILVLSVGFVKDVLKKAERLDRALLAGSWIGYLLTIVTGVWARMAVTGTLTAKGPVLELGANIRIPAGAQIILFLLATLLFTALAILGISRDASQPAPNAGPARDGQKQKPATRLTMTLLLLFAAAHVLRLALLLPVTVGNTTVPMWGSVLAIVVALGLAVAVWREQRR